MTQAHSATISGLYEVCMGVPDPLAAIQYWEQFGYRIGQIGELSAAIATHLYGVNSSLRSIRLHHQSADHGLVRLMTWDRPQNAGLGLESMKVKGNRWTTTLTSDMLNILNHAEEATSAGLPIRYTTPSWEVIYHKERNFQPFIDAAIGVREMLLLQPLTRQVLFQRFGYTLQHYGHINENAALKTSQITHMGLVIQDDQKITLRFYEDVLGLLRARDDVETSYESSQAGRQIFDLEPGEHFWVTAFDEPRSSTTDLQAVYSGRLYIIRFPESIPVPEKFETTRPGCLGMSLYTYRVQGIEAYRDRVQRSQAQQITEIVSNEFGERSFSFIAPDGYFWTLLE